MAYRPARGAAIIIIVVVITGRGIVLVSMIVSRIVPAKARKGLDGVLGSGRSVRGKFEKPMAVLVAESDREVDRQRGKSDRN